MNVLIVGYGSIGARHLRLFQELYPQFDFSVFRRQSSSAAIPGARVISELGELRADPPDLVMICNPTFLHADILEKMAGYLKPGTAVFFEKPYSNLLAGLDSIQAVVADRQLAPFYGCVLRHHPLLKAAKESLDDDRWGPVLSYRIRSLSYLPDWRPGQDYRQSYSAKAEEGGGVLFDLIHEFDYAEWFFGPAALSSGKIGKFSDLDITSDDYCLAQLQHQAARGTVELSYAKVTPVRDFEVRREKCFLRGNLISGELELVEEGESPSKQRYPVPDRDFLYRAQITSMVVALGKGNIPHGYFAESLNLNRKLIEFRKASIV